MKYMFVVAHPDDEVLGGGAFIHRTIRRGDRVSVVILNADYEKTRKEMFNDIEKSHEILGVTDRSLFSFKNMDFYNANHREMVETIEAEIESFRPDVIITHSDKDLHNDHRITSICAQQAARLGQRHFSGYKVKALYFMEVQSSTEWSAYPFKPDTYARIDKQDLNAKMKALSVYQNVVRSRPHPRCLESVEALATIRGTEIGYNLAEAFKTVWREEL